MKVKRSFSKKKLIKYLDNGGDVNIQDDYGCTFLGHALFDNRLGSARLLMKHPLLDISIRNKFGRTIFYSFYISGFETYDIIFRILDVVRELVQLDKDGIVIQSIDKFGFTAKKFFKMRGKYCEMSKMIKLNDDNYINNMNRQIYFFSNICVIYNNHENKKLSLFTMLWNKMDIKKQKSNKRSRTD